MKQLAVSLAYEGHQVTHYRVSGDGQKPITVRTGVHGVFCCLTCHKVDCEHAIAAIAYDRERRRELELNSEDTHNVA